MLMGNRYVKTCKEGAKYCEEPNLDFLKENVSDFNADFLRPPGCNDGCFADGSLWKAAQLLIEQARSPNRNIRFALATGVRNTLTVQIFLLFPTTEVSTYVEAFQASFTRFLNNTNEGEAAGFLLDSSASLSSTASNRGKESQFDISIDGVTLEQWLQAFISDDPTWGDTLIEEGAFPQ